jgi:hypothetical protein
MILETGAGSRRLHILAAVEWSAALALTVFIVVLHVRVLLHAGPLWRDEANTVAVAARPALGQVVGALEYESFPIAPFAVVRGWMGLGLGGSDEGLRTLGFLVGLLLLGALWAYGWLLGTGPPLLALLLVGLNPVVIRWGDSLRGYGLAAAGIALSFGLLWRVTRASSRATVAFAALAGILSAQFSYQNALLLLVMCAIAAALSLRAGNRRAATACFGIGALASASLLPYLDIMRRAEDHFATTMQPREDLDLSGMFIEALGSASAFGLPGIAATWLWLVVAATGTIAAAVGIRVSWRGKEPRREHDLAIYGVACLWITLAVFFLFLIRVRFPVQTWYYIALMTLLAGAIEAANAPWLPRLSWRVTRVIGVVLVAAALSLPSYRLTQYPQTNVDLVARTLESTAGPGDLIVVDPWFYAISFHRYYHGPARCETVPPLADNVIHRYDLLKEKVASRDPIGPLLSAVAGTLRAGRTVWIAGRLKMTPPGMPLPELPPAPNSPLGWWSAPYADLWSLQLGRFLLTHGTGGKGNLRVQVPTIGSYENFGLWSIGGWRDSP